MSRSKENQESESYLLFGRRAVESILERHPERIERVWTQAGARFSETLQAMLSGTGGYTTESVTRDELSQRVGSERHQGIAAVLHGGVHSESLDTIVARAQETNGVILALDQIVDPQNLGSIFRSAAAFDVAGVLLTDRRSASLSAAARKASVGATELIAHTTVKNLARTLGDLQKRGLWVLGTTLSEESTPLSSITDPPLPLVIVLGSEGKGVRRLVLEQCDITAHIEMGALMQSLNVSQAAAVCLHHFFMLRSRVSS